MLQITTPRLTSYEAVLADAWNQGMADSDQSEDARDLAGLRAAWTLDDAWAVDDAWEDYPDNEE